MGAAIDFRQTREYQMGYSEGYKEGQIKAYENMRPQLELFFATQPIKVIVTTEEIERMRREAEKPEPVSLFDEDNPF
jgi:flagellar biosynthesis/type III secretory pathway protein FliH